MTTILRSRINLIPIAHQINRALQFTSKSSIWSENQARITMSDPDCLPSNSSNLCNQIRPYVICGPSGSGKTTLLNMLTSHYIGCFKFSVSHTTRKPRINEQDGIAYHFVDKATFQRMISNNEFVEYAQFSGNYYGTSFRELNIVKCSGRIPILDVDVRGVMNLKRINFGAIYIFITTSSLDNLERNLRQRGTEDNETLNRRLRHAIEDIKTAEKLKFDLIIINQDLTESFEKIKNFVEKDVNLLRQNCQ
ncbi:guanylate kinase [Blomia tropicalis]|nr:guanylate kinase [Blomia tropicalis]